jgi:MFS family permease
VAGAFVGGPLSDRFGRKTVMAVSQAVAGPLLFGALTFAREPIGLPLLASMLSLPFTLLLPETRRGCSDSD